MDIYKEMSLKRLKRGIAIERERLGSKLYLVTRWNYEFGCDVTFESIGLIDSYDSLEEAKMIVDQFYEECLHLMRGMELKESQRTSSIRIPRPLQHTRIECVFFRCLGGDNSKAFLESGRYEARSVYLQVLKTPKGDVLSEDLLTYLNCKDELTYYFLKIGANEITIGKRVHFRLPETGESKSGTIVDVKEVIHNLSEDLDPAKMEVTIISDDLHKTTVTEKTFKIGSERWGMKPAPDATREEIDDLIKKYKELKENPDIIDHLVQALENPVQVLENPDLYSREEQIVPFASSSSLK